jgi:voltage-gated potassium channel Kch
MRQDQPVLFADATDEITWTLAHLDEALLVAFTFPDSAAAATSIRIIRERQPEITIVARARFAEDESRLLLLGANIVIRDEAVVGWAMVEKALLITASQPPKIPVKPSRQHQNTG